MKIVLKTIWHEANAATSAMKLRIWGNNAEKKATEGRLFQRKFSVGQLYANQLTKWSIQVKEVDQYKRIQIKDDVYYWPIKAGMDSLWNVLAEALIPKHPHYYDSFPAQLEESYRVLDIGACEGAFCLYAATKVQKVIAVEPSITMVEAIRLAARDKHITNIECVVGLLGGENQSIGFRENLDAPEASMIVSNEVATEFRTCWTLDTFIENRFPDGIEYIKCDAEGADLEILKSGKVALSKYKPKIAVAAYHNHDDFRKIQSFLESIGYKIQGQGLFYSPVIHKCYPMLLKAY